MSNTIVLWKWRQEKAREVYTSEHVNIMVAMLKRNLKSGKHRIICVTDDAAGIEGCETFPLWNDHDKLVNASGAHLPSCYRRLRMFDPATQASMDIKPGSRITWMDLDAVVTGDMEPVLARKDKFVGWAVRGTYHPRVFNGSFVMFTAGDLTELWNNFDPQHSPKAAHAAGYFGSDQGWLSYNLARRNDCQGWDYPVMGSWPREIRRMGRIEVRTRVVFFHGMHKPWHPDVQRQAPWVSRYWKQ